jgi:hypothetical protein
MSSRFRKLMFSLGVFAATALPASAKSANLPAEQQVEFRVLSPYAQDFHQPESTTATGDPVSSPTTSIPTQQAMPIIGAVAGAGIAWIWMKP